jgi:hypothetical protein
MAEQWVTAMEGGRPWITSTSASSSSASPFSSSLAYLASRELLGDYF